MNPNLTPRQWELLRLYARGLVIKEAAREMGISFFTARHHAEHICNRLNVSRLYQGVTLALREGWV